MTLPDRPLTRDQEPAASGVSSLTLTTQLFNARDWLYVAGLSIRHHPPP
jgi:hypothetical protein